MKKIGFVLITIGLALLTLIIFNYFKNINKIASPIPEDTGVKVIFVTPSHN